ncbi:MAG: hypothetical protein K2Q03_04970 [Sphingobacteriaceae bacterium]|nr:hypothetical protein [Sphingobacteriaceae bacterium]
MQLIKGTATVHFYFEMPECETTVAVTVVKNKLKEYLNVSMEGANHVSLDVASVEYNINDIHNKRNIKMKGIIE